MERSPTYFATTFNTFVAWLLVFAGSLSAEEVRPHGREIAASQSGQPVISIRPTNITRPLSVTLKVTSPTGFDLSHIGTNQVAIEPGDGISHFQATPQPGVNELRVDFSIDATAQLGPRTLVVFGADHLAAGSAVFNVLADFPAKCPSQQECCEIDDATGLCKTCRSQCPTPPNPCPTGNKCCGKVIGGKCDEACVPASQHCM
jgi:hypothetical protein